MTLQDTIKEQATKLIRYEKRLNGNKYICEIYYFVIY